MNKFFTLLLVLPVMFMWSCEDTKDDEELPDLAHVGSAACGDCHTDIYADFIDSGHPYKFNIVDGAAPTYPSFVNNSLTLPDFISGGWDEVAGVIGGFGWKARFVGTDGHVMGTAGSMYPATGGNQHNFFGGDVGVDWGFFESIRNKQNTLDVGVKVSDNLAILKKDLQIMFGTA